MENLDIAVRKLASQEVDKFIELIGLFEVVFEMEAFSMPSRNHLQRLLAQENFGVFVAEHEGTMVGGLTTYVLEQYYSERPLAYIYDLAVAVDFQRQGIGQQLIAEVLRHYKLEGFEEVFVQADKVDAYALDFYRKTKPTEEEDVSHFYYSLS